MSDVDLIDPDDTPMPDKTIHGHRYWREIEDAAFLIWFKDGRNLKTVQEKLETDEAYRTIARLEPNDPIPNIKTLQRWKTNGMWDIKAVVKMQELVPFNIEHAAVELAYGAKDAASSMMRIARGENVTREDRTVMDAAKFVLTTAIGDSVAGVLKPKVEDAFDGKKYETMQEIVEAEQRQRELDRGNS